MGVKIATLNILSEDGSPDLSTTGAIYYSNIKASGIRAPQV